MIAQQRQSDLLPTDFESARDGTASWTDLVWISLVHNKTFLLIYIILYYVRTQYNKKVRLKLNVNQNNW